MFTYITKWASALSVEKVISSLPWEQPSIRMFGKLIPTPRLTCWMGDSTYTYSGHKNLPIPMTKEITALLERLQTLTGATFNSVLANYYRDGKDSVSWHSDDESDLGNEPTIVSLSLGASRDFRVKNKVTGETQTFTLNHGDLLIMSGRSQADFVHCVPKTSKIVGPRINLTFRLVK